LLIPLRHESMRGRRWPIVTFTLIALNTLIFLFTKGPIHDQQPARTHVRVQLLVLAAIHPELHMSPGAEAFVEAFKKKAGDEWDKVVLSSRAAGSARTAIAGEAGDPAQLQEQMDSVCQEFETQQNTDILDQYAFVPARPHALSYVTANFLHGGWFHLIGNMWFLWLAGFILEDNWGRLIYSIFYLVAGAAALQFYAWCAPGSYVPLVGASGAVAALMGGFLVRFPRMKIEMGFYSLIFRYRFKAPAYALLPFWLAMEFLYGSVSGTSSPVAHWAHVGGFLFGMAAAYGIMRSGLEQKASDAIESKIGWSADPDIVRASEALEKSNFDEAAAILRDHLKQKPSSVDALEILQQVEWRRGDVRAYLEVMAQLCQLHLRAQDTGAAWSDFEAYRNAGGDKLPAGVWLDIARMLETQQNFDRAAAEYEQLAQVHTKEKQSIVALLGAGRLYLKRLNRPEDALRNYKAAAASQVPHLDWERNIQAGIKEAERALGKVPAGASPTRL